MKIIRKQQKTVNELNILQKTVENAAGMGFDAGLLRGRGKCYPKSFGVN